MALLSNVPTLSYIRWQNLLITYQNTIYQIYNDHTNKPYIYFDAINSPYELVTSSKKLEERDGLFYILFNDKGTYTVVPQSEIEINFSEDGSKNAVASKVVGFEEKINEQNQKITTMQSDVEGVKITTTQVQENIIENQKNIAVLEQRANEINANVEQITMDFSDDIVIKELRENVSMAILSLQSTLGLFSSDMNKYMEDNKLTEVEGKEITAYKEQIVVRLDSMNTQIDNIIELLRERGEEEKIIRLTSSKENLNTSINNLFTNIDTCSTDSIFTNVEIASIISYFGKANISINEIKNVSDECIYLALGGTLIEEIGKLIIQQDKINLSVMKNEQTIRSTLSKEMSSVQEVIDSDIASLNNFKDCLNRISEDSAFTTDEITDLSLRAVELTQEFDKMREKKEEIEGNPLLTPEKREEISQAFSSYTLTHNSFLSSVNSIVIDGLMTMEEMINLNELIENYRNEINNINSELFLGLEDINKNGIITDINNVDEKWAEIILDPDNGIQSQVGSLQKQLDIVDEKLDNVVLGKVVTSVDVMYYVSTSPTVLQNGSWSTEVGNIESGNYVWNKTVTTYSDGTQTETLPFCITGQKGESNYVWIKYSDNADGSDMYDIPNENTLYIGIGSNKETNIESTNPNEYEWCRFKGTNGIDYYTWIKYADDENGNGISDNPTDKFYIGFAYNKSTQIESDNPSDYTWSLIRGNDGINGEDGKDGTPNYTWIKYSDNENGTDMYDEPNENTLYIGIAVNKEDRIESNEPSDYTWSKFRGEDGISAQPNYTWIRYADDENGEGISNDPTNKTYIGFAYNKTSEIESDNPNDYKWSLIKGADGVAGENGEDGTTYYTWIKYSDNEDGTDMYDEPTDSTAYIGIAINKTSEVESTDKTEYTWSRFKGADGVDAQPNYTWIKYADDENGNGISNDPTNKIYIGFAYNKSDSVESDIPSDYKWSLIKGTDGVNGEDGTSSYTWIKYSDNENGNNMYELPNDDTKYIGIATNKTTPQESNIPSDYIWSKFRGEDGVDGTNGKGIVTIVDYYKVYPSDIGVTNETEGFSTEVPKMDKTNKYLWSYELITYTDETITKTEARVIGTYSTDGKGINSITEYYAINNSSSVIPSNFDTTIPTVTKENRFLWNYEVISYTDGTSTTTDKRVIGVYGETGDTGRGISSIVEQYYLSSSKITQTGGQWVDTPPTWVEGMYMWTRSKIIYSDNSVEYTTPICDDSWESFADLQNQINNNKAEIETTKSTVATHTVSLNNITSRVETNASSITSMNGKITNFEGRLSSAEQKITDDAIINTVSSTISSTVSNAVNNINIGTRNFFLNGDFKKTHTNSSNVTDKHHNLHPTEWSSYNSGIPNPTTSYHAHIDNDTFGYNVIEFNESDGNRNWKGINQNVKTRFVVGGKYRISFDLYATGTGFRIYGGFFYARTYDSNGGFHGGQFEINTIDKINTWKRVSAEVPYPTDVDTNSSIHFYIYGYNFKSNCIAYIKNVSLNQSTQTTDWTPAPEEVEQEITSLEQRMSQAELKITPDAITSTVSSSISSAVNNINIGGRNYIILSKLTSYGSFNTTPTYNGNIISTSFLSTNSYPYLTLAVQDFTPANKVYTLSGYLKVNGQIPSSKYFIEDASSYGNNVTRNDYDVNTGYFVITQTYPGNSGWIMYCETTRKSGSTDVVTFERLKFEEGNKPTDWTPAPEEVEQEITSLESSISSVEQTANKINWIVKSGTSASNMTLTNEAYTVIANNINLTGYVTVSDLSTSGRTTINGSNITSGTIRGIKLISSTSDTVNRVEMSGDGNYYYSPTKLAGEIHFDSNGAGTPQSAKDRFLICSTNDYVLKLKSAGNMSVEANGTIYMMSDTQFSGNILLYGFVQGDKNTWAVTSDGYGRFDGGLGTSTLDCSGAVNLKSSATVTGTLAGAKWNISTSGGGTFASLSVSGSSSFASATFSGGITLNSSVTGKGSTWAVNTSGYARFDGGLGTTSGISTKTLSVSGTSTFSNTMTVNANANLNGSVNGKDGNWAISSTGYGRFNAGTGTSDERLKTDIKRVNIDEQTIGEDGLVSPNVNITTLDMHDFIATLPMVSFRYKTDKEVGEDVSHYGFIAQEVLYTKVGSELIRVPKENDDYQYLTYYQNNFTAFICGALQEEIKQRKELELKVEELNKKLNGDE